MFINNIIQPGLMRNFGGLLLMQRFIGIMGNKMEMVKAEDALQGTNKEIKVSKTHAVNGHTTVPPFPSHTKLAMFGMGCFWGAERKLWQQTGVFSTQVGYAAGFTPNPTYEQVCSGKTGHAEVVRVVYDPNEVNYSELLKVFWESHNPTDGMAQGNDVGTQYRSGVWYYDEEQKSLAESTRELFQQGLEKKGYGQITSDIGPAPTFYYAEDYHQQYLHKNPGGYCGLKGTGVSCSIDRTISKKDEL